MRRCNQTQNHNIEIFAICMYKGDKKKYKMNHPRRERQQMTRWVYRRLETDVFNMELQHRFPSEMLTSVYQSTERHVSAGCRLIINAPVKFQPRFGVVSFQIPPQRKLSASKTVFCCGLFKVIFMLLGLVNPLFTICELLKYPNLCVMRGEFSIRVAVSV